MRDEYSGMVVPVLLGDRPVGPGQRCFIVAEGGVSHFGSMEKAMALVDAAADAGCDAFKIQVFNTEALISRVAEDWRQRLRSKQLSHQDVTSIRDYCRERSILFFATGHDQESVDFLDELDIPFFKIGSGEVKNWPFLRYIGGLGKPVKASPLVKKALDWYNLF